VELTGLTCEEDSFLYSIDGVFGLEVVELASPFSMLLVVVVLVADVVEVVFRFVA
jgi:hypothetical protein